LFYQIRFYIQITLTLDSPLTQVSLSKFNIYDFKFDFEQKYIVKGEFVREK